MKKQLIAICIGLAVCSLTTSVMAGNAGEDILVRKQVNMLIPVSISGFSGEAAAVIKFDLSVLGIVEGSPAQYYITGNNNGRVEGHLANGSQQNMFAKVYQGSSIRKQAHAFAEDIVKEIRQGLKPIFNTQIAFRTGGQSIMEIGVSDFDGFNPTILTHDKSLVNGPTWVPGTRSLLYASWKSGIPQILEHNLLTGDRRVFAKYPGNNYSPAVSPDGRRVAMILNMHGNPDLYVSDINGKNLKQLTTSRGDAKSSPCWAPNSQEICYVSRSGRASLYKISVNGGTPRRLTTATAGGNMTEPDWSPDGKNIVFTSMTGSFNIYVVPAEGGTANLLVGGEDPCWAPNSRTVVFSRRENNKRVLSLLDVPTKHVKDVLQISGSCSQPSWAR